MTHAIYVLVGALLVSGDAQEEAWLRVLFSLSLAFTLCGVGACTQALFPYLRALCYCFGACTSLLPCLLSLFVLRAVCGGFFADLAKQWRKIVGGFLRLEKSMFPLFC